MAHEQWAIDPAHSSINFVVRHMVFAKVRGEFTTFSGTVLDISDQGDLLVQLDAGGRRYFSAATTTRL